MKICIIVDDYMPDSIKVAAKMMHELAQEFKIQGHEVTVITPDPQLNKKIKIEILDDITILRFKSGKIKNVGKIKRALNETILSYLAWRRLKPYLIQHKHDFIIYYSPTIFWGALVYKLKNIWNAPSYLILRDLFPQWAIDRGLIKKKSIIDKYFRFYEKQSYSVADTIGLMSQKNLEWFKNTFSFTTKLEVLYNWAADNPVQLQIDYKKKLGLEHKIVFFYGGNIGSAQDMMNIIRLAEKMKNEKEAHFVLVGEGDEVMLVKEAIEKYKLTNMLLLPSVSQDTFKQMLASFDIGLFTLHKDHTTHNFPGKLLAYMVHEVPILGSINKGNDLQILLQNAKAGLVSINGEDKLFVKNALILLHNEKLRKQIGENAKKLLKDTFSIGAAVEKILYTAKQ